MPRRRIFRPTAGRQLGNDHHAAGLLCFVPDSPCIELNTGNKAMSWPRARDPSLPVGLLSVSNSSIVVARTKTMRLHRKQRRVSMRPRQATRIAAYASLGISDNPRNSVSTVRLVSEVVQLSSNNLPVSGVQSALLTSSGCEDAFFVYISPPWCGD